MSEDRAIQEVYEEERPLLVEALWFENLPAQVTV